MRSRVIERQGTIRDGDRLVIEMKIGPFTRRWVAEHHGYVEGREFRDSQVSGPFAKWEHTHRMIPDGPNSSLLEDSIDYVLPFGLLGRLFLGGFVRRDLERTFRHRHQVTIEDLKIHRG